MSKPKSWRGKPIRDCENQAFSIPKKINEAAHKKAASLDTSFSEYVTGLIESDLRKTKDIK